MRFLTRIVQARILAIVFPLALAATSGTAVADGPPQVPSKKAPPAIDRISQPGETGQTEQAGAKARAVDEAVNIVQEIMDEVGNSIIEGTVFQLRADQEEPIEHARSKCVCQTADGEHVIVRTVREDVTHTPKTDCTCPFDADVDFQHLSASGETVAVAVDKAHGASTLAACPFCSAAKRIAVRVWMPQEAGPEHADHHVAHQVHAHSIVATAAPHVTIENRHDHAPDVAHTLRHTAEQLDNAANVMERKSVYEHADRIRDIAHQLREEARDISRPEIEASATTPVVRLVPQPSGPPHDPLWQAIEAVRKELRSIREGLLPQQPPRR